MASTVAQTGGVGLPLNGLDGHSTVLDKYMGQEFDKQYAEIKAETDKAEDGTEEKQHLLWRLFEMSRRRTEIVGTWKA